MRDLSVSPSATVLLFAASIALSAFTVLAQTNKTQSISTKGIPHAFRFHLNPLASSVQDYVTSLGLVLLI